MIVMVKKTTRIILLVVALFFIASSMTCYAEATGTDKDLVSQQLSCRQKENETFVLVHGAWHGAWCWDKVAPLLRMSGHRVITIDLPGHGQDSFPIADQNLQTYVNKVVQLIDHQPGKVILVGHSMAGCVISEVAEYRPHKVKKLVYLAAFLLQNGQSIDSVMSSDLAGKYSQASVLSADGKSVTLKPEYAKALFYNDCSEQDTKFALAHLSPEAVEVLGDQVEVARKSRGHFPRVFRAPLNVTQKNWGSIPKVYIKTLKDNAVPPDLQRQMLAGFPDTQVYELNTGHSPFFAAPAELTGILLKIHEQKSCS